MQLYRHAVSLRIGLGKLSTLPSVSDLGREEGGDCGREKNEPGWALINSIYSIHQIVHKAHHLTQFARVFLNQNLELFSNGENCIFLHSLETYTGKYGYKVGD